MNRAEDKAGIAVRAASAAMFLVLVVAISGCGAVESPGSRQTGLTSPTADTLASLEPPEESETAEPTAAPSQAAANQPPVVLAVSSQRCDRPKRFTGAAVAIGGNQVVTAAHLVDGDLRQLLVDDQPATVLALSAERDLAVLTVEGLNHQPPTTANPRRVDQARIHTPNRVRDPVAARRVRLRVATTDGDARQRQAYEVAGAVDVGTSGSALVGPEGHLLGVMVLSRPAQNLSYASTVVEIDMIVADSTLAPAAECP